MKNEQVKTIQGALALNVIEVGPNKEAFVSVNDIIKALDMIMREDEHILGFETSDKVASDLLMVMKNKNHKMSPIISAATSAGSLGRCKSLMGMFQDCKAKVVTAENN